MGKVVSLRLAISCMSLFFVAVVVFALIHLSPTDPIVLILGEGSSESQHLAMRQALGLDRPLIEQFASWLTGLATGDLGTSIFTQRPVTEMLADTLPVTMALLCGAVLLAISVGLGAGLIAGLNPTSWFDRLVTSCVSVALALPSFWFALLLMLWFGVKLRLFPVAGYTPLLQDPLAWLAGLVLPSVALSVRGAAVIARHMRGIVVDVMEAPFIEAARARGTPRGLTIRRYLLKNAFVSMLPIIGIEIAILLASTAVIEKVFVLPGMGALMVNAVIVSDFPLLQGAILIVATIVVITNLLVDVGLGLLDSRIRPK